MSSIRCNLIVIRSTNLMKSARFYTALGLRLDTHRHGDGPEHLASEAGEQTFEIYPLSPGAPPTTEVRLGFAVEEVDTTFERLVALGAKQVSSPKVSPWGRRAIVTDPDGHRVELIE